MNYDLDFSSFAPFTGPFLAGAVITLQISIISFVIGTLAGLGLALILILFRRNFRF